MIFVWLLSAISVSLSNCDVTLDRAEYCETNHNPTPKNLLKNYVISLNTPPKLRWVNISRIHKQSFQNTLKSLENKFGYLYKGLVWYMKYVLPSIPEEYVGEMKGISQGAEVPLEAVVAVNLLYEISTFCTSIVMKNAINGEIYHGRNLDFGLLTGWNETNHSYIMTDFLREIAIEITWEKDNKPIAKSTTFVGFIGFITAMSTYNGFSFSMNQRFAWIPSVFDIIFNRGKSKYVSWVARELILNQASYEEALERFTTEQFIAPSYIIIGSAKHKAALITRGKHQVDFLEIMDENSDNWFLLVTNTDTFNKNPPSDDRYMTSEKCIKKLKHNKKGALEGNLIASLLNILSKIPVLNKMTIHTTVMQLSNNTSLSYLRDCPDPCSSF